MHPCALPRGRRRSLLSKMRLLDMPYLLTLRKRSLPASAQRRCGFCRITYCVGVLSFPDARGSTAGTSTLATRPRANVRQSERQHNANGAYHCARSGVFCGAISFLHVDVQRYGFGLPVVVCTRQLVAGNLCLCGGDDRSYSRQESPNTRAAEPCCCAHYS